MFVRSSFLLILTCFVADTALAQSATAHPSQHARASTSRSRAAAASAPSVDPASESDSTPAPAPTYADRRYRATIALRSGIFGIPAHDLGFVSLGLAIGFGAPLTDSVSLLSELSFMVGGRPIDETGNEDEDEDESDAYGPDVDVNLSFGFAIRKQVAGRYFDLGPTFVTHWMESGDGLAQIKLGGGMRFGAGAFVMRRGDRRAGTLGAELRIERVAEAPSFTLDFRWGAAF